MKLDNLMKIANTQRKRANRTDYDITLQACNTKADYHQVSVRIRKNPKNIDFTKHEYWLPVFVQHEGKLYILPSDSISGFKHQPAKTTVGGVYFFNKDIHEYLTKNGNNGVNGFHWSWDSECSRPYIQL